MILSPWLFVHFRPDFSFRFALWICPSGWPWWRFRSQSSSSTRCSSGTPGTTSKVKLTKDNAKNEGSEESWFGCGRGERGKGRREFTAGDRWNDLVDLRRCWMRDCKNIVRWRRCWRLREEFFLREPAKRRRRISSASWMKDAEDGRRGSWRF